MPTTTNYTPRKTDSATRQDDYFAVLRELSGSGVSDQEWKLITYLFSKGAAARPSTCWRAPRTMCDDLSWDQHTLEDVKCSCIDKGWISIQRPDRWQVYYVHVPALHGPSPVLADGLIDDGPPF